MAGRRLRDTVKNALIANGFPSTPEPIPIIVGLANTYTSYITTYEEYEIQRYEGASTIFGPHTLSAYQQEFTALAIALAQSKSVPTGPLPRNLTDDTFNFQPNVLVDIHPLGKGFGSVLTQPHASYKVNDTVSVVFQGANPRNNLMTMSTFLTVDFMNANKTWTTILTDADWDTRMLWERVDEAESHITIEWDITSLIAPGTYRIRHSGYSKNSPIFNDVTPYAGTSNIFTVG